VVYLFFLKAEQGGQRRPTEDEAPRDQAIHLIRQALEQKISQKQAAEGDGGILHRRRGKPSNRRIADKTKQKVVALFV